MRFDLAQMTARSGRARKAGVDLNVIYPTKAAEGDLARIYMKVLRSVAEFARDRLIPSYRSSLAQRAARDGIRDDVSDLERDLGGLGDELQRLILTLIPEMRDWTIRTERWHRERWAANVLTATTVDLRTIIGPEDVRETMEAVLARNTALIRDLAAQAQGRVADAVWRGFQNRTPARDVAKSIDEAVGLGRKRALRIASHQTQLLSSQLDTERATQAGLDEFTWRHSRKLHPRPEHVMRDGKVYRYRNDPRLNGDMPGVKPACGCKAQAFLSFDGEN